MANKIAWRQSESFSGLLRCGEPVPAQVMIFPRPNGGEREREFGIERDPAERQPNTATRSSLDGSTDDRKAITAEQNGTASIGTRGYI